MAPSSQVLEPPENSGWFTGDDADSFLPTQELTNVVGGVEYHYVTDPTTATTDSGRSYSLQLGIRYEDPGGGPPQCSSNNYESDAVIYLVYTDDGVNFSSPIIVKRIVPGNPSTTTPLDHPFMDIEHVPGGNDRLHIAWWNVASGALEYAYYDDNVGLSPTWTLRSSGYAPRVTANDLGEVYIYTNFSNIVRICKLKDDLYGCSGDNCCEGDLWNTLPSELNVDSSDTPAEPGAWIRTVVGYSMAASQTEPGVVFYCFQHREDDGTEKDIKCARGQISAGVWTWSPPTVVNEFPSDDKDQFNPEVMVTADDDAFFDDGTIVVTWYDRADSSTNYEYTVERAISVDYGNSFTPPRALYGGLSDPMYLPRHCLNSSVRFIGDFAASRSSTLHGHSLYIVVPPFSSSPTTNIGTDFGSYGAP